MAASDEQLPTMEEKPSLAKKLVHTMGFGYGYDVKPYGLKWRSNTYLIIFVVALSLATENFLYGLIVPILPFMLGDRIGIPQEQWQLWVSASLAAFAFAGIITGPIAGYIADLLGSRKWPWLSCLVVMIFSIAMFFSATSIHVLLIARVLMGAASSAVWTIGLTLCMDTVGVKNLGKALATVFAAVNFGSLIAPSIGGILYERLGLKACAAICYALIAVDLAGRLLVIEKRTYAKYEGDLDPVDSTTEASTEHSTTNASDISPDTNNEQAPLLSRNDADEDRDDSAYELQPSKFRIVRTFPILYCFRYPSFMACMVLHTTYAVVIGAFDATIPTHAIDVWQVNPLQAGLILLPLSVVALAAGPVGGWCTDRYGPKFSACVGSLWLVPFLTLLRIPQAEPRASQIALYEVLLGLTVIGVSMINTPSFKACSNVVERAHKKNPELFGVNGPYASLYGLFNVCFSTGLTIGPIICGSISDRVGYGNMNAILAAWMFVVSTMSFFFIGNPPPKLSR